MPVNEIVPSKSTRRCEMPLTNEEILRYSRHLIIPEVGVEGQKKLKEGKVLLIGAGGLGSPLALYLAAAGVGTLGLVDFDVVDLSNLQRQILYGFWDVGRPKLESAREKITALNPLVAVQTYETRLTSANALTILGDYDVIVDGTDNFPTRYLTNDACVLLGKPNVYGSIFRFEGQCTVFDARRGPCYRCLYPHPPPPGSVPSCAEGGVLGVLPGIIGTLQAMETIKLLLGLGEPLIGRLVLYDALSTEFHRLTLRKDPACPLCGEHPTITELIDYDEFCGLRVPAPAFDGIENCQISPQELKARLDRSDPLVLIDVREPHEYAICRLEGARLMPFSTFAEQVHELNSADELVLLCRNGLRSLQAVQLLWEAGFRKLYNLAGGLDAWATRVDPTMPRY